MDKSYRQKISIQVGITETNDYNTRKVVGYRTIYTPRAKWIHTGGSEQFRGRQVEAGVIGVFEIRYHPQYEITPDMYAYDGNIRYGITSARPSYCKTEGGFKTIEIFVKGIA